jgi:riboflavin kinase/FMN adenylyltransferase
MQGFQLQRIASSMPIAERAHPHGQPTPSALAIGTFDGVHLGHHALLTRLCAAAADRGLRSAILTFEPAPREWFACQRGETPPTRIASLRNRVLRLRACGVQRVCVTRFGARLASMEAEDFVKNLLVKKMGARYLLVGDDFRFGARRVGDFALLETLAPQLGFEVAQISTVLTHDRVRISSSAVRERLGLGDLTGAAELLGSPWRIDGHVIYGAQLGRTLGFPTMNLRVPTPFPAARGVFVVQVQGLSPAPVRGVASLGTRPAVEDAGRMLLEVHLLDWQGSAYGRVIGVEFLHKLRDEEAWSGPDALALLTAQIRQDVADARAWFTEHGSPAIRGPH